MKKVYYSLMLLLGAVAILSSCNNVKEDKLGEYAWLEGTWESNDDELWGIVVIEKDQYKAACWMYDDSPDDIKKASWTPIDIQSRFIDVQEIDYLTLSDADVPVVFISPEAEEIGIITGEYSSMTLHKTKGTTPKKDEAEGDKAKPVKEETSVSLKSTNKLWKNAFKDGGFEVFETGYNYTSDTKVYVALLPFVYSEDGLNGKVYFFGISDDMETLYPHDSGDYEIHGEYIRFSHMRRRAGSKAEDPNDRIYKVSEDDGCIILTGKMIGQPEDKVTMRQSTDDGVRIFAKDVLDRPRYNQHGVI